MKSRFRFVAALVSVLVLALASLSVAQTQQPPPKTGQDKPDKSKKPAEQDGFNQVYRFSDEEIYASFAQTLRDK